MCIIWFSHILTKCTFQPVCLCHLSSKQRVHGTMHLWKKTHYLQNYRWIPSPTPLKRTEKVKQERRRWFSFFLVLICESMSFFLVESW